MQSQRCLDFINKEKWCWVGCDECDMESNIFHNKQTGSFNLILTGIVIALSDRATS